MKQTAVQFVVNELEKLTGLNLKDEPIIEKALEMEKEQIVDAWDNGYDELDRATSTPYHYYNKTYKSE